MSEDTKTCPVCGAELPHRTTGRPATYCGKSCRQAAHRAKQRAQAAARHAVWLRSGMIRDLDQALETLTKARGMLAEPLREAERTAAAAVTAGGEEWHATPPTDWEDAIQVLAVAAGRHANNLAGHLREHARSAAEHGQAAGIAGIRRAPAAELEDDETPAARDTVDRDAVFNAIEDLIMVTDVTTAAGSSLPDDLGAAIAGPVGDLTEAWAEQSGTGSLDRLTEAAHRVIEAARPYEARWSATLATFIRITEKVIPPAQQQAR